MTRFMISLEEGALSWSGTRLKTWLAAVYVRKIPSMTVGDIAEAARPGVKQNAVGIRPGEKAARTDWCRRCRIMANMKITKIIPAIQ
jgi:FlaA1/EpsC-like NDP-sugar epimerase